MFQQKTFLSADGLTLAYRDSGAQINDGRTMVCLAGMTRNSREFAAFAALRPHDRILALDLRGRGLSQYAPAPLTYRHSVYADDVRALFDAARIDRAVLVGASLGGTIAMLAAQKLGERVEGLILNDVGPDEVGSDPARIAAFLKAPLCAQDWDEAARKIQAAQAGAFPAFGPDDWLASARRYCSRRADGTVRADYDPALAAPYETPGGLETWDKWAMFDAIADRPMLLVRGALSTNLPLDTVRRMQARAPRMAYVEAPGVGHHPDLTEPEVAAAISEFLA